MSNGWYLHIDLSLIVSKQNLPKLNSSSVRTAYNWHEIKFIMELYVFQKKILKIQRAQPNIYYTTYFLDLKLHKHSSMYSILVKQKV